MIEQLRRHIYVNGIAAEIRSVCFLLIFCLQVSLSIGQPVWAPDKDA